MNRSAKLLSRLSIVLSLCAVGACANVDYEQAAFETLSRVQCEDIEARGLCNRSFTSEYAQWRDDLEHYRDDLEREQGGGEGVVDGFDLPTSLVITSDDNGLSKQDWSFPGGR